MIIPFEQLEKDTLYNLIQAFVLREGTEYGEQDVSMDVKVEQVMDQLRRKEAVLLYSELHETVNIVSQQEFQAMSQEERDE